MPGPLPKYVTSRELAEILDSEVATLSPDKRDWWLAHRVAPFPAMHNSMAHFVVAIVGERIIFFADDEDEFGIGILDLQDHSISSYGLAGDLKDAVGITAQSAV